MTRLDVPGGWADLYDPTKVPERKRRPVVRALAAFVASQKGVVPTDGDNIDASALVDVADGLNDATVLALVQGWSFGEVNQDVLLDLPADAYKALKAACEPSLTALLPDFSVSPDPKAPTGASS